MKKTPRLRLSKLNFARSIILISGLCGFAAVAISSTDDAGPPVDEISNGASIQLDGGVAITPIKGWKLQRKSAGVTILMSEPSTQTSGAIDYSKPIFERNISLMTLSKARPIDARSIDELKAEITKIISKNPSLRDFTFTDAKLFDYKGKNDGVVLFSQLIVNNFQMQQMQIVVSGDTKSYLITYSDLASNFSNPTTFDTAWKSMTSITVPGIAPRRFEKEMIIGGALGGSMLAIILPFFLIRWRSSRSLRRLADELQYDWDHGAIKTDADYELSDIQNLEETRILKKQTARTRKDPSDISLLSSCDSFSTRHSRFA